MRYSSRPSYHQSMVFDQVRNSAYFKAIAARLDSASRVLDLGAGVGVLGLEAARLGAQKVYLLDPSAAVRVGGELARANGLADRVEVIEAALEKTGRALEVDLILSVFTGNFLLEEDFLPLLFQARDRFLAPGGALIPDRAVMRVAPVAMPAYYAKHIDCWGPGADAIDYAAAREYAVNTAYHDAAKAFEPQLLAAPTTLAEFDFMTATTADCDASVELEFTAQASCHGFLGWFDIRLGEDWLSTSPLAPATHWCQVFFPFREPLQVAAGDRATLALARPERGEWTWRLRFKDRQQVHTTAMAAPLQHADLRARSESSQPALNDHGRALLMALQAMDGSATLAAICDDIIAAFPGAFASRDDAMAALAALARESGDS